MAVDVKSKKLESIGKKVSLKEREYDPNKHCGVTLMETGKQCTRTLTCKSHALSLRRQVEGRSMPFDKLLSNHRNMRAAQLKGKQMMAIGSSELGESASTATSIAVTDHIKLEPSDQQSRSLKREFPQLDDDDVNHLYESSGGSRAGNNSNGLHRRERDPPAKRMHFNDGTPPDVFIKLDPDQPQVAAPCWNGPLSPANIKAEPMDLASDDPVCGGGGGAAAAVPNNGFYIKREHDEGDASGGTTVTTEEVGRSMMTVPLSMLGNVMCVNGKNCIIQTQAIDDDDKSMEAEHQHPENGEAINGRKYLTLSSNRHQRATNRLKLNVLKALKTEQDNHHHHHHYQHSSDHHHHHPDYPGIEMWYNQIPTPSHVNCFKLKRLGSSSAVLSRRYLNIHKTLIMNMASNSAAQGGSPAVAAGGSGSQVGGSGVLNAGGPFGLSRSLSQSSNAAAAVGGGSGLSRQNSNNSTASVGTGSGVSSSGGGNNNNSSGGYTEKVNFSVERIKV